MFKFFSDNEHKALHGSWALSFYKWMMDTKLIQLDQLNAADYDAAIREAATLLQSGELVAFPTETVYGLGGNALDPQAASKIFAAKGRPQDNPLIVHVSHIDMVEPLVSTIPPLFRRLAFEFWPGPLTLILPKSDAVPSATTGELKTVALRMPSNRAALDLIDAAALPIAAPSANASGKPSTTRADHVYHDLKGRIPLILDGGAAEIGLESTILDLSGRTPTLLRPGKITFEELRSFAPSLTLANPLAADEAPRAPGMKYPHYAPNGTVHLLPESEAKFDILRDALRQHPDTTALIISEETWNSLSAESTPGLVIMLTAGNDLDTAAHRLFHAFRSCDQEGMRTIYVEGFAEHGLGAALMNRVRKTLREEDQAFHFEEE